jgi:hypothetical protein
LAEREDHRGGDKRSPSPRRGEGWGEGARAVALSEESRKGTTRRSSKPQGKPEDVCPNRGCANRRRPGALRPFAIFREERARVRTLWGPNCSSLQIIHQVCPACSAIRTGNQCD